MHGKYGDLNEETWSDLKSPYEKTSAGPEHADFKRDFFGEMK